MNRNSEKLIGIAVLAALFGLAVPAATSQAVPLDVRKVMELATVPATITADGVVRISWARTDVAVKVDGMSLVPFAGLTTWASFAPTPRGATVAGDTVVFEDEVDAAMDAALAAGLEIVALHNHFFHEEPRVYSMHIGGEGLPDKLVVGVKTVWDAIQAVRAGRPAPATTFGGKVPKGGKVDARQIERILKHRPETQDGVVKVTISRDGAMRGTKITSTMGVATWAAFSGADDLAAMDGEFVLVADEVQPVLRALRKEGIHVVSLHNNMMAEQPTFYFAHFWGKGKAEDLGKAFAAALVAQKDASKPAKAFK